MPEVIGEIIQKSSGCKWEWRIPGFLSLPEEVGKCYRSDIFFFSGGCWELRVYPHGESDCEGYVSLYLCRMDSGPSLNVSYNIGVRKADGDEETPYKNDGHLFSEFNTWGMPRIWPRTYLVQRRAVLAPSEVLTVIFTLKENRSYSMEEALYRRLWNTSIMLQGLLTSTEGADVTFKLEDGELPAHRLILKARSEVFNRMFTVDMKESHDGEVLVPEVDKDSFKVVLAYMYSGVPQGLSPKNMCKVYGIAHKYELGELVRLCVEFIKGCLSLETVCDVILLADLYQETELKNLTRKFVGENVVKVVKLDDWKTLKKEHFLIVSECLETILVNNAGNITS